MSAMLILAAAALASSAPQGAPVVVAQATATIRVIRAVQIKFGKPNPDAPPSRERLVKSADGSPQRAELIEFQ